MRLMVCAVTAVLLTSPAKAETGYLCKSDKSVGFAYDASRKTWLPSQFTKTSEYVVRPSSAEANETISPWIVMSMNPRGAFAYCDHVPNEYKFLICQSGITTFKINLNSLRFMTSVSDGYWNFGRNGYPDTESTTPYLEIGTCTQL